MSDLSKLVKSDPIGTVRVRTRVSSSHSEGDFTSLPPEPQQGNVEYKLKLVNPTNQRMEHLVTQVTKTERIFKKIWLKSGEYPL